VPVGPVRSCTELQWARALGCDAGTSHRLSNVWRVCGSGDTLTGCACWFVFQPCLHPCEQTSSRWRPAPRLSFHPTCSARRTARLSIMVSLLPLMIHVSAPAHPDLQWLPGVQQVSLDVTSGLPLSPCTFPFSAEAHPGNHVQHMV